MIYSYKETLNKYKNVSALNDAIKQKELFKLEKGVYSDKSDSEEIEILSHKHKNAVFTLDSAYYYHDLTDYVPDKYYLATTKDAYKIRDGRIKQIFYLEQNFNVGVQEIDYNGIKIRIYDKERMLIELIRRKSKMAFDYYKEIVRNYRSIVNELDISKIQDYILKYSNSKGLYSKLMLEVF